MDGKIVETLFGRLNRHYGQRVTFVDPYFMRDGTGDMHCMLWLKQQQQWCVHLHGDVEHSTDTVLALNARVREFSFHKRFEYERMLKDIRVRNPNFAPETIVDCALTRACSQGFEMPYVHVDVKHDDYMQNVLALERLLTHAPLPLPSVEQLRLFG